MFSESLFYSFVLFRPQAAWGTGERPSKCADVHPRYACAFAATGGEVTAPLERSWFQAVE